MKCPKCGAAVNGKFCSECGTPVGQERCAACRTELSPEAKYCHRCGLPVGAAAPVDARGGQNPLPWAVAGIALVALVALVAGQKFGGRNQPNTAPDTTASTPASTGRPPNLDNMSQEEQRIRLYDRVMRLAEQGKSDSVAFFAPMAIMVYEQGTLDHDGRYDLGRLGEVSKDYTLAAAQADTILKEVPNHLLALALAGRVAKAQGNTKAELDYAKRFLAAEKTERAIQRPEYQAHANDVETGARDARALAGR